MADNAAFENERILPVVFRGNPMPGYFVSDNGSVYTKKERSGKNTYVIGEQLRALVQQPTGRRRNYRMVTLWVHGKPHIATVHRLVAEAFIGSCPVGMEVCHNDGDSTNNTLSNLRYDTQKANNNDKKLHGTSQIGEKCNLSKLTYSQVLDIHASSKMGEMQKDIAKRYGVHRRTVSRILKGRTWSHLSADNSKFDKSNIPSCHMGVCRRYKCVSCIREELKGREGIK